MKSCAVSKLRSMPVYEASAVVGKDSAKEAARVATVFRDKTGKGLFWHAMVYGIGIQFIDIEEAACLMLSIPLIGPAQ